MEIIQSLLWVTVLFSISGWLISRVHGDASIADVLWGLGFIGAVWFYRSIFGSAVLVPILVSIWGMRLAIHIYLRNRQKGPDFRYETWRLSAPQTWWWRSFFKVFLLQAFILAICSLVLIPGVQLGSSGASIKWICNLGFALWVLGFLFEAIADLQLFRFKRDPGNKGKVLDKGLWSLSRHPNYFGECVLWWGIYLIGISSGQGHWTIVSPLLLSYLLLRVSGVTMLEKELVKSKDGYSDYVARTPAFFPNLIRLLKS